MDRTFLLLASIFGGLAVALGAFGAHGLEGKLSEAAMGTYQTGVQYQFYHALALMGVAFAISRWPGSSGLSVTAGWLFVAGILIFSGSLYILVMTDTSWLGAITPFGGVAFIIGWILLGVAAWRGA